jgi:hypothetical protein
LTSSQQRTDALGAAVLDAAADSGDEALRLRTNNGKVMKHKACQFGRLFVNYLIERNLNVFRKVYLHFCTIIVYICKVTLLPRIRIIMVMRRKSFYRADYLFPKGSFIIGIGSVGALFKPYFRFNSSHSESQADRTAMESDFGAIGGDIHRAIANYR